LHWAANEGNGKVIEKLINSNIDINLKTNLCQTAAQIALSKGYETVCRAINKYNQFFALNFG
jgi:ankyrin repeat protein